MKFYYNTTTDQTKNIILDAFRPGDYVITVRYRKKINVIFQDGRLNDIVRRLKEGYRELGKELMFVGVADTKAVRLIVNAGIDGMEMLKLLWDMQDYAQVNVLKVMSRKNIEVAAENMLSDTKKYILVSDMARRISELWQRA